MAASMNLEYCLDDIENLPFELQRNFELMRDLDQRAEDLKVKIDTLTTEYLTNIQNMSPEERRTTLKEIQEAYAKCKEYSEDKVQIATQTYMMVDKHIQQLDTELARFEAEQEKPAQSSVDDSSSSESKKRSRAQKKKKAPCDRSKKKKSEEAPKARRKKLDPPPKSPEHAMPSGTSGNVSPSNVMDMPVDPHEPTYCLCRQVSYGEMIGCDNPDCAIEWFHFPCVGLTAKPRGKWFCPNCSPKQKK